MVNFTAPLLVRSRSVAVEDIGSSVSMLIKFNSLRIREFTSIVSEDNRKQFFKGVSPKRRISFGKKRRYVSTCRKKNSIRDVFCLRNRLDKYLSAGIFYEESSH